MRVFINTAGLDVEPGTDVLGAIRAHDAELEAHARAGTALVSDGRGIALPLDARLEAGSILRVVVSARRGAAQAGDGDA